MLDFLRRSHKLIAPISGRVMDITEVPDEIFAQKMAGDGIAVDSTSELVLAPAEGVVSLIFKSNHAFAMTLDSGIEILIHIGLDTVKLDGKGFYRIAEEGQRLKAGEPVIRFDRDLVLRKVSSLITPVLITKPESIKVVETNLNAMVEAGRDTIMEYKLK
jgi:sugar PTS system EIIA component